MHVSFLRNKGNLTGQIMQLHYWCLAGLLLQLVSSQILEPCRKDAYPPHEKTRKIQRFALNLDLPGDQRWAEIVQPHTQEIKNVIQVIKDLVPRKVIEIIDEIFPILMVRIPQPYAGEIQGISRATGIPLGEIILYNIFYEINPFCTSIIGQDESGKLFHGRNLDFGLMMGWDNANNTWILTERLRDAMIIVDFQRDGKTIYSGAHFVGYIGMLTAVKKNAFTMTINARFGLEDKYMGILQWLDGQSNGQMVAFLSRQTFENATNYDSAMETFSNAELVAPIYFIIGGTKKNEGAVITRSRTKPDDVMTLKRNNSWYLLQTNYDNWKKPLFVDDRRTPGNKCMKELTRKGMNFKGLFNVLSTKPNYNKMTTYTALMQVDEGTLDVYLRDCPDPCYPW